MSAVAASIVAAIVTAAITGIAWLIREYLTSERDSWKKDEQLKQKSETIDRILVEKNARETIHQDRAPSGSVAVKRLRRLNDAIRKRK